MILAILFDLDGVLANTKKYHVASFAKLFLRHGLAVSDHFLQQTFGRLAEDVISEVCKKNRISCPIKKWAQEKRNSVLEIFHLKKVHTFPGVKLFFKFAQKHFLLGLGTSSSKQEYAVILSQLGFTFKSIVGREHVKKHKPNPAVYLALAKKLNVAPACCLVIEDSLAGVAAAKSAGMFCVAVTNSYSRQKLKKAGADIIVRQLADLKLLRLLKKNF